MKGIRITEEQRRTLNSACGDLARQIVWHGNNHLSKDDWRHMVSGTVLGWRMVQGLDTGDSRPGLVMLGGSSLDLTKDQASLALEMIFALGDCPAGQGLAQLPVKWCEAVCKARDPKIMEEPDVRPSR